MKPRALIVVGASWGGVDALRFLIGAMTPDCPAPMAIVQHRGDDPDDGLLQVLRAASAVPVNEVEDKDELKPGHVYLAPSNYHLLVEGPTFALSTDPPVSHARPSIDVLFETAADAFGSQVIGVILTGAGKDGPHGALTLKQRGGTLIVQDPETAEQKVLPQATLNTVRADQVLPLPEIVPFITGLLRRPGWDETE